MDAENRLMVASAGGVGVGSLGDRGEGIKKYKVKYIRHKE